MMHMAPSRYPSPLRKAQPQSWTLVRGCVNALRQSTYTVQKHPAGATMQPRNSIVCTFSKCPVLKPWYPVPEGESTSPSLLEGWAEGQALSTALEKAMGKGIVRNDILLFKACTHASAVSGGDSNMASLTAFGDAVWNTLLAIHLSALVPEATNKQILTWSAALCTGDALAQAAAAMGLGPAIMYQRAPGLEKPNAKLLKDHFRALWAVVYLSGGLESAVSGINRLLAPPEPWQPFRRGGKKAGLLYEWMRQIIGERMDSCTEAALQSAQAIQVQPQVQQDWQSNRGLLSKTFDTSALEGGGMPKAQPSPEAKQAADAVALQDKACNMLSSFAPLFARGLLLPSIDSLLHAAHTSCSTDGTRMAAALLECNAGLHMPVHASPAMAPGPVLGEMRTGLEQALSEVLRGMGPDASMDHSLRLRCAHAQVIGERLWELACKEREQQADVGIVTFGRKLLGRDVQHEIEHSALPAKCMRSEPDAHAALLAARVGLDRPGLTRLAASMDPALCMEVEEIRDALFPLQHADADAVPGGARSTLEGSSHDCTMSVHDSTTSGGDSTVPVKYGTAAAAAMVVSGGAAPQKAFTAKLKRLLACMLGACYRVGGAGLVSGVCSGLLLELTD